MKVLVGVGHKQDQAFVKSVITAWLLKKQGFTVKGAFFGPAEEGADLEKKTGIPILTHPALGPDDCLFQKLIALKNELHFDKIATGHQVILEEVQMPESDQKRIRILENADGEIWDAFDLKHLHPQDFFQMILPLGSIPKALIQKLAQELGLSLERPHDLPAPERTSPALKIGPLTKEIHFQEVSWFSRLDLGVHPKIAKMALKSHSLRPVLTLLQYENREMKGFFNQTLDTDLGNIFPGDPVLWIEGTEIMGSSRILRVISL